MPLDSSTQIIVTIGAYSCQVWDEGTTRATFERDGFKTSGRAHWRCAYGDAAALAQALLGGSQSIGAITIFQNGFSCPAFFGLSAQKIEIRSDGILTRDVGTGFGVFERAVLDIEFGYDEFAAGDATNNIGELQMEFEMKDYPLDRDTYTFLFGSGSGNPVNGVQKAHLEVAIGNFKKILYNRPIFDATAFLPYINTVNATPVNFGRTLTGASFQPGIGQIYFPAPIMRTKLTPGGLPCYDIIYNFKFHPKPEGWNSLPQAGNSTLWQKVADSTGNTEFGYSNLNDLLTNF